MKYLYRNTLIINLLVFIIIESLLLYSTDLSKSLDPIYGNTEILNLVFGNKANNGKGVNINIDKDMKGKAEYNKIINQASNLYYSIAQETSGDYGFNNSNGLSNIFNLEKRLTDSSNLQIVYDKDNLRLNIISPRVNVSIANKEYGTNNTSLYSIDNISPDSIISINDKSYKISEYQIIETTVWEINNRVLKIYKPTGKELLDKESSSFERGFWQVDVGDCSDKLEGTPNINEEISSDASDGLKALNLSSKNHYACVNNTFPFLLDENKYYSLSFDYKNLVGRDIRYYYKLRNENINESLGYAFSATIQASDNDWHTLSTVIDPKMVKENFVYPQFNEDNIVFDKTLSANGIEWVASGDPIKDIKYIDIFLYAPSDGGKEIVNLYDNVHLSEYSLADTKKINLDSLLDTNINLVGNIILVPGLNTLEYSLDKSSLLDNESASFENGLWQKESGDCSNSLSGKANVGLKISNDSSNGTVSAELSSNNHYACISKTYRVSMSNIKTYKLLFDYKNIKGDKIMYYYNLNSNERHQSYSETIKTNDNNWHTIEKVIDSGIDDVNSIDIFFYAPSDGSKEIVNLYDNVRLTEWMPKDVNSYYLHAEQKVDESPKLKSVEYKAVNMWKDRVILHGVNSSFLLIDPEKYSEKLKAYAISPESYKTSNMSNDYSISESESNRQATKIEVGIFLKDGLIATSGSKFISKNFDGSIRNDNLSNGNFYDSWFTKSITEDLHFEVNSYGNSWWIDIEDLCKNDEVCRKNEDGTFDIELIIENKMLKWLYIGLLISGTILTGYVGYLGYDWRKRRKKKVISLEAYQERDSEA